MRFRIERAPDVERDLQSVFRFLIQSYVKFGEEFEAAKKRARLRVDGVEADLDSLGRLPHQGTRLDHLMSDLRCVTKDRAVFYFTVHDDAHVVRVLAVFFGGQDHQRAMLGRLLRKA